VAEGFPFLGFVVYPSDRRLKRRKVVAFQRKLKQLVAAWVSGTETQEAVTVSLQSWFNHVRYGDTWGLRQSVAAQLPL
jgi:hypothetical protein